jgi:predicted nucleic acid-binding protein
MNVYIDASALVKRYVAEAGSASVNDLTAQAAVVGTSVISRAETAAALAKAVRMKVLSREEGGAAMQVFSADWENLIRLQMTELLMSRAAALAWSHGLRGYDAVHLAVALFWQEVLGEPLVLATYDKQLWVGAKQNGLQAWPDKLVAGMH